MEITFSRTEVKEIILCSARKFHPELNTVKCESYHAVSEVTVSCFVSGNEPSELEALRKTVAEQKQYIACMESPS